MRQLCVTLVALCVSIACFPRPNVAAPTPGLRVPDALIDLAFSRGASTARLKLAARSAVVLRADRDIVTLKTEFRPAGDAHEAGRWHVRLVGLPATEECEPVDTTKLTERNTVWNRTATVQSRPVLAATQRAVVPRSYFRNWVILIEPLDADPHAIELFVQATPIDLDSRLRWLMLRRSQYDPESTVEEEIHRARARDTICHLTDEEVRYWTSLRDRAAFLAVWLRMKTE